MSAKEEENRDEAIRLAWAWEGLFLYTGPDDGLRDRQKALLDEPPMESASARSERLQQLQEVEAEMKRRLVNALRLGDLVAIGRDLTNGFEAKPQEIPQAFFDSRAPSVEIDWENSKAIRLHQSIIEIVVYPPDATLTKLGEQTSRSKVGKSKAGRPRSPGLDEAVAELHRDPNFAALKRKEQCDLVRMNLFGSPVPRKDYGDSAIKTRLRSYKGS